MMERYVYRVTLLIDGPFCYTCVQSLMRRLKAMNGIVDVKINMVAGLLMLYSEKNVNISDVQKVIEDSGFKFLGRVEG